MSTLHWRSTLNWMSKLSSLLVVHLVEALSMNTAITPRTPVWTSFANVPRTIGANHTVLLAFAWQMLNLMSSWMRQCRLQCWFVCFLCSTQTPGRSTWSHVDLDVARHQCWRSRARSCWAKPCPTGWRKSSSNTASRGVWQTHDKFCDRWDQLPHVLVVSSYALWLLLVEARTCMHLRRTSCCASAQHQHWFSLWALLSECDK